MIGPVFALNLLPPRTTLTLHIYIHIRLALRKYHKHQQRQPQAYASVVSPFALTPRRYNTTSSRMDVSARAGHELLSFINASPTPFHAVDSVKQRLEKAGFKGLDEKDSWSNRCVPGGKYYLTRNASTILAFAVGKKWRPGNPVAMIGAHTDSPTLRVKPVSKKESNGFMQVGVETYGGGLWHTWFDRDLSMAGRVVVKDGNGDYVQKLVKIERPILRIPTLAIHLDRQEPFTFNKETHLFPIAGLVAAELNRQGKKESATTETTKDSERPAPSSPLKALGERHHPYIIELISKEAKVKPSEMADFEMVLYDTQKSCVGGINEELLFSPRLDNLEMSFCSTIGLLNSVSSASALDDEESVRLISLFDHEEIGSQTAQGADSNFLPTMIRRLSVLPAQKNVVPDVDAYEQTLSKSFLVSADMAHSVNPNYAANYEVRLSGRMSPNARNCLVMGIIAGAMTLLFPIKSLDFTCDSSIYSHVAMLTPNPRTG